MLAVLRVAELVDMTARVVVARLVSEVSEDAVQSVVVQLAAAHLLAEALVLALRLGLVLRQLAWSLQALD